MLREPPGSLAIVEREECVSLASLEREDGTFGKLRDSEMWAAAPLSVTTNCDA